MQFEFRSQRKTLGTRSKAHSPNVYLSEISTECPECAQLQKIIYVGGARHLLRRLIREAEMVRLVKDSEEEIILSLKMKEYYTLFSPPLPSVSNTALSS